VLISSIKLIVNEILKNKIGIKSPLIRQLIIYSFVALIPTVADFSLLYFLTEFAGFYYLHSLIVAFVVGVWVSYVSQKNLTFKNDSKKYAPQFSVFCGISLIGLLMNTVIVFSLVEFCGLWYIFGKIISTGVVLIWNFSAHRHITFEKFQ